jgi:hypothetical protein
VQNFKLTGGVIIIGSLLWDKNVGRDDWRQKRLNLLDKILVKVPIRYGRFSTDGIYTMVFSTDCEKRNKLGTGFVVPLKENPIESINSLICEGRMMAGAEGMKNGFVGKNKEGQIWASLVILFNRKKGVDPGIHNSVLAQWTKEFEADGGGHDTSEYRVGKEKSSITKKGELQISWPNSVDPKDAPKVNAFDFLIATSTKPKHEEPGKGKYASLDELTQSVRNDSTRRYFFSNYRHAISTFQDNNVVNLL